MSNSWKKITAIACLTAVVATGLAGCGGKSNAKKIDKANPEISVMTMSYQMEPARADSPVMKALEEYLGTKLNISFVTSSGYGEKVTATMGAGTYPQVMLITERNASVIQNSRGGTFWEIGEKIKDSSKYPNLAQANQVVMNNISIDGKAYGIYRGRTLGRNGGTIRKDWLDKLNLPMPSTLDELYTTLKAFKDKDPDGNGQNDTFGMIVTTAQSTFDNIAIWAGAPNKWGVDAKGELEPAHLTDEYMNALKFMKKLYDEKLINQDFATYDGAKWDEQFLTGKAGVIIDVADRARRVAQNISSVDPKAEVEVFGYVKKDAATAPKTLPTTGYAGYYVFPKKAVADEEDLEFILKVMDKANDEKAQNLMNYGIEGRQYTIDDNGFVNLTDDASVKKEFADLNQFATGVTTQQLKLKYATKTAERVEEVYKDNESYVVPNPAEPFVSDTYSQKGATLDDIVAQANTRFIAGQINEDQYKQELERWKQNGGTEYIKEINEQYKTAQKNK